MIPLSDAIAHIASSITRFDAVEVARADALGLVLADAVTASEPVPPFANTAVDGYAVQAADTVGASVDTPRRLTVVGELAAGAAPSTAVGPGTAIRIMTGAPMPAGADAVVIRHPMSGAPHQLAHADWASAHVINAGDGMHEHPTQALLDAFTLRRHLIDGRDVEGAASTAPSGRGLDGLTIAIVGDILHSRVARSNVHLLSTLGARVVLVGPPTLMPTHIHDWPASVSYDMDAVLPQVDAVMMLRIQNERMNGGYFPSSREYSRLFGLDSRRAALLPEHAIVMHPGPMNRGVEITPAVADGPRSVVIDQVRNGVSVRMAVLYLLLSGSEAAIGHAEVEA